MVNTTIFFYFGSEFNYEIKKDFCKQKYLKDKEIRKEIQWKRFKCLDKTEKECYVEKYITKQNHEVRRGGEGGDRLQNRAVKKERKKMVK